MLVLDRYAPSVLLRKSGLIEFGIDKFGDAIIDNLAIADLWVDALKRRKRTRDIRRVLKYIPEKGLFYVFLAVLEKPKRIQLLTNWLKESGDLLAMRRIALSGKGEEFDGARRPGYISGVYSPDKGDDRRPGVGLPLFRC